MKKRIRILIIDDKPSTRNGLKALLAFSPQIEVVGEASTGLAAIQLVKSQKPDVVLMDVRMPIMDGLQATRKIKQRWPDVKVILLTMYLPYERDALRVGADAFLLKGCSDETLRDAILTSVAYERSPG